MALPFLFTDIGMNNRNLLFATISNCKGMKRIITDILSFNP
jgi:hypothetical protein